MRNAVVAWGVSAAVVVIAAVLLWTGRAEGTVPVTPYEADVNKNGAVNAQDLGLVANRFGQPVPTPTATPSSYCNLSGRDFSGDGGSFTSNLSHAFGTGDLDEAPPYSGPKPRCSFAGANFTGSYIGFTKFHDADFTNALFTNAHAYYSHFYGATMIGLQATGLDAPSARFDDANLTGADFSGSLATCAEYATKACGPGGLNFAIFTGADLTGANLSNISAYYARFNDANLTNVTLSSGQTGLTDAVNAFNGTLFFGAVTTGADVTGVIWNNTTCPDGTNSDNHGNTCIGYGFD